MNPSIFTSVINSYLPEPHASLLNGIIFGIPLKTSGIFYEKLRIVGLLHIVVLSGINITLLAAVVAIVFAGLGKKISIFITIFTIVCFVIFVGPQPPIIRAAFMGILSFIAILYGKRGTALYALFISFFFIAVFWPRWITSVSLQLSYAATLGIILFGTVKPSKIENKWDQFKFSLRKEFKTSLAAQIFTSPLILIHFKQFSLFGILSTVAVSWTIAPIMIFGFATAILGKLNHFLGILPSQICYILLSYVIYIVEIVHKISSLLFNA